MMNDELRRQIIAEVSEYATPPSLDEDEFTAVQYAEAQDLHIDTARNQLNKQVKLGKLETRWVMHDQHRQKAYRLTD